MGAVYKNYKATDYKNLKPGYSRLAWLVPISWIDTFAEVVGNAAAGDRKTIDDSHVLLAGKGAIAVLCSPKTTEAPAELTGPQLGKSFQWKPKIYVPGDSAALLDMVDGVINDNFLLFIEDAENCANGVDGKIQFGCECDPAVVSEGSFSSGVVGGDTTKGFELTLETFCKYFYNGDLVELDPLAEVINP